MSTTRNQTETMNHLFKTYGLVYDAENKKDSDVFITKNFKIITRTGIEKIQAKLRIRIKYEVLFIDPFYAALKATCEMADEEGELVTIETTGEASVDRKEIVLESQSSEKEGVRRSISEAVEIVTIKGNVKQDPVYLLAMAEKRAKARGVLQLAGLYALGVYSEDEADDFSKELKKERGF